LDLCFLLKGGIEMNQETWNKIVKECYNEDLNFIFDVVKVIYSNDREERAVILRQLDGLYTVAWQKLYFCEY